GTVEIRVCDTPLKIETAVALGAYAQTLAKYIFDHRELVPEQHVYLPYSYNRFQACRFGLEGVMVNSANGQQAIIRDDILRTFTLLESTAEELGNTDALEYLRKRVFNS